MLLLFKNNAADPKNKNAGQQTMNAYKVLLLVLIL